MTERENQCPRCWIGTLHVHNATYSLIVDDTLLTIPHAPMLQCDICGLRDWKQPFLDWVEQSFIPNILAMKDRFD